jgi:hypothetical protein
MDIDAGSKYVHVDLLNSFTPEQGFCIIYGNTIRQFDGKGWTNRRMVMCDDADEYPIVYGWIKPGDWVRVTLICGEENKKMLQKRYEVTHVFMEKIQIANGLDYTYLNYYQVELSINKYERKTLQAARMVGGSAGKTYYKVKE